MTSSASAPIRIVLAALMLVAAVARLAAPSGWMPHRDADGVRLVLCPGSVPVTDPELGMAVAHHGGGHAEPDRPEPPAHPEQPCAFTAVAAALAEPASPAPAVVPPPVAPPGPRPIRHAAIGRGLAAPPPPATGPPLRA